MDLLTGRAFLVFGFTLSVYGLLLGPPSDAFRNGDYADFNAPRYARRILGITLNYARAVRKCQKLGSWEPPIDLLLVVFPTQEATAGLLWVIGCGK